MIPGAHRRTLHLDSGREMRGGQWQVLYLLRGLAERGHAATLLACGELLDEARAEGLDAGGFTLPALFAAGRHADLVHAHDARSHSMAALCAGAPLVVSRRVAFPVRTGLASRWKYRRASHYIAISDFVAGRLRDAGIKSASISVVYDGVPIDAARAPGRIVLAPASSDPMKGSDLARQAAALAGVEIDFTENLRSDLDRAAMLVYLTRSEGLGSAALLAMARGVPVIASRVGGLEEAVEDGETGLLVENDPPAVAAAIRRLLDDPELSRNMGRRALARAQSLFSVDRMVDETIRIYEKILP